VSDLTHEQRLLLLAELHDQPAWREITELMQKFVYRARTELNDPNWVIKKAYEQGSHETVAHILRLVTEAHGAKRRNS